MGDGDDCFGVGRGYAAGAEAGCVIGCLAGIESFVGRIGDVRFRSSKMSARGQTMRKDGGTYFPCFPAVNPIASPRINASSASAAPSRTRRKTFRRNPKYVRSLSRGRCCRNQAGKRAKLANAPGDRRLILSCSEGGWSTSDFVSGVGRMCIVCLVWFFASSSFNVCLEAWSSDGAIAMRDKGHVREISRECRGGAGAYA